MKIGRIAAVALVAAVSIAAGVMASVIYGYWQGQAQYDQVAALAFELPLEDVPTFNGDNAEGTDEAGNAFLDLSSVSVDWAALRNANADAAGWVYVPNTPIDYPVVHSHDNDEYLYVNFNGQRANGLQPTYGTPFLMAQNAADFSDRNNVIQAHNMQNGSMFAWIGNAALSDHAKLQENRTAYLFTPAANYRLTSIAVLVCNAEDEIAQTSFSSSEEFTSFVERTVARSAVDLDMSNFDASKVSKLVSLSTCTSDGTGRRCVLVCAVSEAASPSSAETGSEQAG